jgi:hypothetical protein
VGSPDGTPSQLDDQRPAADAGTAPPPAAAGNAAASETSAASVAETPEATGRECRSLVSAR